MPMDEAFLFDLLPRLRANEGRNVKVRCPVCSPTRRKSSEPCLSIKLSGNTILWNCHHCDEQGAMRLDDGDTAREAMLGVREDERKVEPLNADDYLHGFGALEWNRVRQWLEGRGISMAAVARYLGALTGIEGADNIKASDLVALPAPEGPLSRPAYRQLAERLLGPIAGVSRKNADWLGFPMYDMKGNLINIQFRHCQRKAFKLISGRPVTFYGAHLIGKSNTVIITEGQVDALSVMHALADHGHAGSAVVLSLPNGSNSFSFDPEAWLALSAAEDIIYAGDTDEPGHKAAMHVADRMGRHRVRIAQWPDGCKDANDTLQRYGTQAIVDAILDAQRMPVEGVFTAAALTEHMSKLISTVPDEARKPCGIDPLDDIFTWAKGELTLITGIPGHGKSTFVDQVIVGLAKHAGWRTAVLSFEKSDHPLHALELVEKWLEKPVIGTWSPQWQAVHGNPPASKKEIEDAIAKIDDHFVFFDVTGRYTKSNKRFTIDNIISKCEEVVYQYGVDCVVIDNMSFIEKPRSEDMDSFLMRVFNEMITFTQKHNVCMIVVAHPRKPPAGSGRYIPTGYDVYGTSMGYNKVHNGITVYRDQDPDATEGTLILIWKGRSRANSKLGTVALNFNSENGCFYAP